MSFEGCTDGHELSRSLADVKRSEEYNSVKPAEAAHNQKLDMDKSIGSTNRKKKESSNAEVQHSLRQEIILLEKRLQEEVSVRRALEKGLGDGASSNDIINEAKIPKRTAELIKEVAVLEEEVEHLEQYLLSLYRKAFDQQVSAFSPSKKHEGFESPLATPWRRRLGFSSLDFTSAREFAPEADTPIQPNSNEANGLSEVKFVDSGVRLSHSLPSHYLTLPNRTSSLEVSLGKVLHARQSPRFSMTENSSSHTLSDFLGAHASDYIPENPSKLSEDMVKCMCNIYFKLADSPLTNNGSSSPFSSLPSISASSAKDQYEWSLGFRNDSSLDRRMDISFHVDGLKDFSGPYGSMIEVNSICRDSQKLGDAEHLFRHFRYLVSQLEEIDPRKMTHEEKLAFWINVHNALVMHAFLAHGIPQNSVKRMLLLLKAAYNIGGLAISVNAIKSSILGREMHYPGQVLVSSKTKSKAGDEIQVYGIERREPLLYFALSSGSHSDPAVRVYTPKRVFQELEAAKEDYIQANFWIRKDHKILLPKIVGYFAKDSGWYHAGILEMIGHSLPSSQRISIKKSLQVKHRKNIEWVPHNFTFRYLIHKELIDQ